MSQTPANGAPWRSEHAGSPCVQAAPQRKRSIEEQEQPVLGHVAEYCRPTDRRAPCFRTRHCLATTEDGSEGLSETWERRGRILQVPRTRKFELNE